MRWSPRSTRRRAARHRGRGDHVRQRRDRDRGGELLRARTATTSAARCSGQGHGGRRGLPSSPMVRLRRERPASADVAVVTRRCSATPTRGSSRSSPTSCAGDAVPPFTGHDARNALRVALAAIDVRARRTVRAHRGGRMRPFTLAVCAEMVFPTCLSRSGSAGSPTSVSTSRSGTGPSTTSTRWSGPAPPSRR